MPSITNINKLWKAIPAVVAAVMLASCSEDAPEWAQTPDLSEAGYVSLSLRSTKGTRAETEADVQSLNENLISNALVCLYPTNMDTVVTSYVSGLEIYSTDDSEDKVKVLLDNHTRLRLFPNGTTTCGAYVMANIGQAKADSVIYLLEKKLTTLDAVREMVVYDDYANRDTRSRFAMDGGTNNITLTQNENNYSATGKIDLQRVASKITLAVKIADRVTTGEENEEVWTPATNYIVALINNGVCRSSFITMGENAYVPKREDVSKGGDYFSSKNVSYVYGDGGDDYGPRILSMTDATKNNAYPYVLQRPFYTMPNRWEDENDNMTYITLRVPWTKDEGQSYQYCYYTVPIVREHAIGRNISYRVNLNIDMLGSFVLEDPIVPDLEDLSYYAAEWGSATTNVDITSNRYLVVDQNEFTLNNEANLEIPFYTSHPATVKDVTLTYYRYYMDANGSETAVEINNDKRKASTYTYNENGQQVTDTICSVKVQNAVTFSEDNKLIFNHELVEWTPVNARGNEVSLTYSSSNTNPNVSSIDRYVRPESPEKSYTRYEAKITLVHSDMVGTPQERSFTEEITITQYPQMYIEATANYYNASGTTAAQGNTYVNGQRSNSGSHWYNLSGITSTATNKCSNQYVITVTQLDNEPDINKQYIIGDPRTDEIDLMSNLTIRSRADGSTTTTNPTFRPTNGNGSAPETDWLSANALYYDENSSNSSGRKLQYYYPTDASTSKARWIAPKFRIASSYAVHSKNSTYNNDKLRCAAYQELQYPAGRWRMPTVAEVEYIMKLSQSGKIPVLFSSGTQYMTAQGAINTNDLANQQYLTTPANTEGSASVRCVYDEWYWGDDVLKPTGTMTANGETINTYTFTWGDRPRQ